MSKQTQRKFPSYRLHKPTGQAVVTLDGRDIYLGRHGVPQSRECYDRLIAQWLANGRKMPAVAHTELTVTEMVAAYWRHATSTYQPKHLDKIKLGLRPLKRLYGTTKASEFGPLALQLVRQAMIDEGLARTTINAAVVLIRGVFKWGVAQQLVEPSILQGLQAVNGLRRGQTEAREPGPVTAVPEGHISAIKPFVGRQVWALVQLQLLTGARPGELVITRPIDIDMNGPVWTYRPQEHKNRHRGQVRLIHIGPKGQEVIRPFMSRSLDCYLFSPREAVAEQAKRREGHRRPNQKPSERTTSRRVRDRYDVNSYRQAIVRACDRAGIDRWHPHQIRHTRASELRRLYGEETARLILGHSKIDTTRLYGELDTERASRVMLEAG